MVTAEVHCSRASGRKALRQCCLQSSQRATCANRRGAERCTRTSAVSEHVYSMFTTAEEPRTAQPVQTSMPRERTIVFALDGTEDGLQACEWATKHIANRTGDVLHLCHILCNDRIQPTAVGMTGAGMSGSGSQVLVSLDEDFGYDKRKDFVRRRELEAQNMIASRFLPVLNGGKVSYRVGVEVVDGQRAAATIAEAIVKKAQMLNADMLVVASHGGGLLCDYGSVARYCVQHFDGPVALVPPNVGNMPTRDGPGYCVAVNTLAELQATTEWAMKWFQRSDDRIAVLRVPEETLSPSSTSDQTSIMLGLNQQMKKHKVKDLSMEELESNVPENATPDQRNQAAAQAVIQNVKSSNYRAMVMVNYASRGMMQEMMFGTLTMLCSRRSPVPLILIPPNWES